MNSGTATSRTIKLLQSSIKRPIIPCLIAIFASMSQLSASVVCNPGEGSVVIEAEKTYDSNFLYGSYFDKPNTQGCLGRGFLNLNVFNPPAKGGPWYARWTFHVPADGIYHVWLLDYHFAGKMEWQLNNSPFTGRKTEEEIKTGISPQFYMDTWHRITADPGIRLSKSENPQ
ncbi:MAG: hypothetical protein WCS96_03805, partial [Victivallales bacterium]